MWAWFRRFFHRCRPVSSKSEDYWLWDLRDNSLISTWETEEMAQTEADYLNGTRKGEHRQVVVIKHIEGMLRYEG